VGIGTATADFGHCRDSIFHKSIFGTPGYERKPLSDVAQTAGGDRMDNLGSYGHAVGGADNVHHNRRNGRSRIRVHGLFIFRSSERLQAQAGSCPDSGCERNEHTSQNTPDDTSTKSTSTANDALPPIEGHRVGRPGASLTRIHQERQFMRRCCGVPNVLNLDRAKHGDWIAHQLRILPK
jgi:hypothetical protein